MSIFSSFNEKFFNVCFSYNLKLIKFLYKVKNL